MTLEPDERVAATELNSFVDSGDFIWACLYHPVSGKMTLTFNSNGSVEGEIDVTGYSGPCHAAGTQTPSRADISGS